MKTSEVARAKVNLSLYVVGRRPDGYHLLDSIVTFADFGDRITVAPADRVTLTIDGPFAAGLAAEADNLVLRAARLFGDRIRGAEISLTKNLPVASGIGGGSADAAATLRALSHMAGVPMPDDAQILSLGADVPACMESRNVRMRGIGEKLEQLSDMPALPALLINPGIAISTARVFANLNRTVEARGPQSPPDLANAVQRSRWLRGLENHLTDPAIRLTSQISEVIDSLLSSGSYCARMSGSGATCFGLFASLDVAKATAVRLRSEFPHWWVQPVSLGDQVTRATT
jgi:4-diphosphocytidyl-2-C-methyl-D-erythritol kinase